MKLEPNEAEYLRTIVRSQVMTARARTKLLDLIDGAAGQFTGAPAEVRYFTPDGK